MFKRIFQSQPPQFRLPGQDGLQPTFFGYLPPYDPALITPPRLYAEEISSVNGLWTTDRPTLYGVATIQMWCVNSMIYWPGWEVVVYNFDATTGAYLGIDTGGGQVGTVDAAQVNQSRDGALWAWGAGANVFGLGSQLEQLDPNSYAPTGLVYAAATYGLGSLAVSMVETAQNLMLAPGPYANTLGVYNLATGALIRYIPMGGNAVQILPEDDRRCYVVLDTHLFHLIDYQWGTVLSTFKSPTNGMIRFAYDRILRRLLGIAALTVDVTGQSTTTILGWNLTPLVTGIGAPIPLQPIRTGRTTQVLVQTWGDAGEPVAGQVLTPSVGGGNAALAPQLPITDNSGEALFSVTGTTPGPVTLSVTAQLPPTQ